MSASRILGVREAQRRMALARLSSATRAEAGIAARRDMVARLVADTLPCPSDIDGADFVARMSFAGRLAATQVPLGEALGQAQAASLRCLAAVRHADSTIEIATRMQAQDRARNIDTARRQALEELSVATKRRKEATTT